MRYSQKSISAFPSWDTPLESFAEDADPRLAVDTTPYDVVVEHCRCGGVITAEVVRWLCDQSNPKTLGASCGRQAYSVRNW